MNEIPHGTVTFLFTDVEGSTEMWERHPDLMAYALAVHDRILRDAIDERDGYVFSTAGDAFAAAFWRPADAIHAALTAQTTLAAQAWPPPIEMKVRMGVHLGSANEREGDYFGPALNVAARIMSAGHGGQILLSDTTADLVRDQLPTGVALADRGLHQLKGIGRAHRLKELTYGEQAATSFPPLRTTTGKVGNLVHDSKELLGRAEEMEMIRSAFDTSSLVTVLGVGGAGKTMLACHAAGVVGARFGDGAWLCELGAVAPGTVADAVAKTLGVQQQRGLTTLESILAAFAAARALIVVDNCEHVIDEAALVVEALVRSCPGTSVLCTSREALGLGAEVVIRLDGLMVPPPGADVDDIQASPAVRMFVERANGTGTPVVVDDSTAPVLAELCRQLDGLPLAIELAAARVRSMSLDDLARRLDERFRLLQGGRRDAPARQRTLRDTVEWSYNLLQPNEQTLFKCLSVFTGGFTITAASAVSGAADVGVDPDDVEQAIWNLADRSLLRLAPGGGTSRYEMLETLRQYGVDRLRADDLLAEVRGAHLGYFLDLAETAHSHLNGPTEGIWAGILERDFANLRSAHRNAQGARDGASAARLVAALHDFAMWRQLFELGTWAESTLDLPGSEDHVPILCATAGWGHCIGGDLTVAKDLARRGLLAESNGMPECGWLHDVLAHCAFFAGDDEEGMRQSEAEIERARASSDATRLWYVLADNAGHGALIPGLAELATRRSAEAMELARTLDNPTAIAMSYLTQGFVRREEPREAIDWFRRAAEIAETVGSRYVAGTSRAQLALLSSLHGEPMEALVLLRPQLVEFRRSGDVTRMRTAMRTAIPALSALLPEVRLVDVVRLDAATVGRRATVDPLIEAAVANATAGIAQLIGAERSERVRAEHRGIPDSDAYQLTLDLIDVALASSI